MGKGRSLENLKMWEKGWKGGPGRPKGSLSIKRLVERMLNEGASERELDYIQDVETRELLRNKTRAHIAAYRMCLDFMYGDKDTRKLVTEMIDGKPVATNINLEKEVSHEDWVNFISRDDDDL